MLLTSGIDEGQSERLEAGIRLDLLPTCLLGARRWFLREFRVLRLEIPHPSVFFTPILPDTVGCFFGAC